MAHEFALSDLLMQSAFIGGQWVSAADGGRFDVFNPATEDLLASVPNMNAKDVQKAVDQALEAFTGWKERLAGERASILKRWNQLILDHTEELALLMTLEQGKPLKESRNEIVYAASFVEWFAEEARRTYGDVIPSHVQDKRILTIKQPVGVVAAITPWNFPAAMITRKVAPALAAGCTVLVKPSELTPLTALALAKLSVKAGFPSGVFNVLTVKDPSVFGTVVMQRSEVRKISFTGSTRVGKILMGQAAATVKRVSLELGGNAPFIVFDDADLDTAVEGALTSKYRNAGQTCVCSNRIFVQSGIYDHFVTRYTAAVARLKVGAGNAEDSDIGPLIDLKALEKVNYLVQNAVLNGAKVVTGGTPSSLGKTFFNPTVITHVQDSMTISKEEIFGPVSAIYRFDSEDEVIARANNTPYGLASYFYTKDLARSWRVSEKLDFGIVGINTGLIATSVAPFGGMKESGLGREGSKYGMDEFLETKYVCVGGL